MGRRTWQALLAAALWGSLATGCNWTGKHGSYASDPLLVCRKPVEAKPQKSEPVLVARSEPASPEPPSTALASAPVELQQSDKTRLVRHPRDTTTPGVTATPASRSGDSSRVPAAPAVRRRSGD